MQVLQGMTDSAIKAMHEYLNSKTKTDITDELYNAANTHTLQFFEIMFQYDLKRLGLIK